MGWIAGPLILFAFAFVTWYTSLLLADAYRYPKDVGKRNYTYPGAVEAILGASLNFLLSAVAHVAMSQRTLVGQHRIGCMHWCAIQTECCCSKLQYHTHQLTMLMLLPCGAVADLERIILLQLACCTSCRIVGHKAAHC